MEGMSEKLSGIEIKNIPEDLHGLIEIVAVVFLFQSQVLLLFLLYRLLHLLIKPKV